jgi:hypothetical protein
MGNSTDTILAAIAGLKDHFDSKIECLNAKVDANHDEAVAALSGQGEGIARMEGRLDEQSRILAAMIPTRLAAVPPERQAS